MRSYCSACIVAGSRMSAYFAVSVMNSSLDTMNRSSRSRPATIWPAFGACDTGLEL